MKVISYTALASLTLLLSTGCGMVEAQRQRAAAGYLGCPSREVRVNNTDPFQMEYAAACRGQKMICTEEPLGVDQGHITHCAPEADPE